MHIYVHIPFCLKKCSYCDFTSITDISCLESYVQALLSEIELWSTLYYNKQVKTVFFGGGTPSILLPEQLARILNQLRKCFQILPQAEISLEANPETLSLEKLSAYHSFGINRLSLGVQSVQDQDLQYLGRVHSAAKATEALGWATRVFTNVNVDLMMCLPGQTVKALRDTIEQIVAYSPQHISCYELTFEANTPLYAGREAKTDDVELSMAATALLEAHGYAQYEISNYAVAGFQCAHNLAYWTDQPYLGLGVAAHSYDSTKRFSQGATIAEYNQGAFVYNFEAADSFDRIMMGLRLNAGVPVAWLPPEKTMTFEAQGLMQRTATRVFMTDSGRQQLNAVLRDLL